VDWQVNRRTLHGQDIRFRWKDGAPGEMRVRLPLLGDHQALNAATALTALRTARDHGVKLSQTALLRGLRHVIWPGRFETLQTNPLLIIDSAHNPDSAAKLRQTVETYLPGEPVFLVFGAFPCVKRVYATQSTHPRAAIAGDLAALAESKGVEATPRLPLEDALAAALADAASVWGKLHKGADGV